MSDDWTSPFDTVLDIDDKENFDYNKIENSQAIYQQTCELERRIAQRSREPRSSSKTRKSSKNRNTWDKKEKVDLSRLHNGNEFGLSTLQSMLRINPDHNKYDNIDFLNKIAIMFDTVVKETRSKSSSPEYRVRTVNITGNTNVKNYLIN